MVKDALKDAIHTVDHNIVDKSETLWKNLAIILISVVVTGVAAFIAMRLNTPSTEEMQRYVSQNSITSEEVRRIIERAAPREQEIWKQNISSMEKLVSQQQDQVDSLKKEVEDSKIRQVRMDAKLDLIIEELRSQRNNRK